MLNAENRKFYELLSKFDTAMLVTRVGERLTARPMAIARVDINCDVWFITGEPAEKVDEINADPRVLIVCQQDHDSYLSLSGTAIVTRDRAMIEKLWKPVFQVWFPQAEDDPAISLIKVQAEQGEYWDNRGVNKIKYFFQATKAYLTGTVPEMTEGDQYGEVTLGDSSGERRV